MLTGRERVALAVEARVAELGLTQTELGVDPSTYRDFVKGRSWPNARTRMKLEVKLGWDSGEIARKAAEFDGVATSPVPTVAALRRARLQGQQEVISEVLSWWEQRSQEVREELERLQQSS